MHLGVIILNETKNLAGYVKASRLNKENSKTTSPMKKILIMFGASLIFALNSQSALLLNETFSYADGSITANSGGVWTNHSGTAGQVDVTSGVVNLTQAESEDVSAGLSGGPFATGSLYASFKINLSTLPLGAGNYFLHFRDTGTTQFRARVFATTAGAVAGSYRVGIGAGGTALNQHSRRFESLNRI